MTVKDAYNQIVGHLRSGEAAGPGIGFLLASALTLLVAFSHVLVMILTEVGGMAMVWAFTVAWFICSFLKE